MANRTGKQEEAKTVNAIILNLMVIAVIVTGWTAAVWASYIGLDDSRALRRTARNHEVVQALGAGSRPATRRDVRRAA